jgi:hypothetical protein
MSDWDPSNYEPEPDLSGPYRSPPPSSISDRDNAAIHYALEEFYRNMSDYEVSIGRALLAGEKYRHIQRFEGRMRQAYGAARPDPDWLSRHESWHGRNGGGAS